MVLGGDAFTRIHYLTFELDVKFTQNIAQLQYPLHHVTFAPENVQWFRRSCIYMKIHEMLPSTIYIMLPMHLQSLKLLPPTVKEKMHLQEHSLFDQGHMICCPVPFTSCNLYTYKV